MILEHYKLTEQPFGATPDARYLYASETHREALASLLYAIDAGRGFMALIAKPGMGKTTLLFRSLTQLREKGRTVFLFQTISTPLDFLRTLLADLGVQDLQGGMFELQAKLNEILVEQRSRGERLVVVIDETQNLDDSVLELVRMLSNFETPDDKLIQIVLSGQPQLARKLASPNLVQLRQRISVIAHLRPLTAEETAQYVEHRLQVAGYKGDDPVFTPAALQLVARHSEGIPRNINNLCFNAMSIGAALKKRVIDADIIREVIGDLDLDPLSELPSETPVPAAHTAVAPSQPRPHRIVLGFAKAALASAILFALSGLTIPVQHSNVVLADTIRETSQPAVHPTVGPTVVRSAPGQASKLVTTNKLAANAPVPAAVAPASPALAPPPVKSDQQDRILVPPGVTLYQICAEALKTCHTKELSEIHRLNPWLVDPNHLESGRTLRLPSAQDFADREATTTLAGLSQKVAGK